MNSTWLITSELTNQRARKVLFAGVVYTVYTKALFTWKEDDPSARVTLARGLKDSSGL